MFIDVPSPIDLRQLADAQEWAETALIKRPWRIEFFNAFAAAMAPSLDGNSRVLELGSGPGFLAEHLLTALPSIDYVALDFSAAMHQLAIERLGLMTSRVAFVERSFRDVDWFEGLGEFQYIVTNQAVHELRHKQYAARLHAQARGLLAPNGIYLVCDHFCGAGGMTNDQLFMSVDEQREALLKAGFAQVEQLLLKGGMVLHRAS